MGVRTCQEEERIPFFKRRNCYRNCLKNAGLSDLNEILQNRDLFDEALPSLML